MKRLARRVVAHLPGPARDRASLLAAGARERRLRRGAARIGLVLVYHRTGPVAGDPDQELDPAFPIDLLRRQLAYLRRRFRPIAAADVLDVAAARRPGDPFPVAVTFDDDLRSHLDVAAPVLRELGVPATAFLTGSGSAPWWDRLQRAVDSGTLAAAEVPELEPALVEDALRRRPRAMRRLARTVEALPPETRDAVARRLGDGVEPPLRPDDVARLAAAGVAIGFHTAGHYDLRTLDDDALDRALREGRDELERASGGPLTIVAYPHGKCDDRVASAAGRAGFRLGFTGEARAVRATDDPRRIPRLQPARSSAGELALQLTRALSEAAR